MNPLIVKLNRMSSARKIIFGFLAMILLGALFLYLPISTKPGQPHTSFLDAVFTSASATCTVGLIRYDTFTHWTLFGQAVILLLIQIGGFGFMTLAIYLATITKRRIGLSQRALMQDSVASPQIGGIVKLTRMIFLGTFAIEGIGALLLAFYFVPMLGFVKGIWFSLFHSISAFCNAGFDLMGFIEPSASLVSMQQNVYVNIIIMALGITGGLGFFVLADLKKCKLKYGYYRLHTKLVLVTTAVIVLCGSLLIYIFELGNGDPVENIMPSCFQAVMAHTCGYASKNVAEYTHASQLVMIVIMAIGASPGSTRGGMKTTTVAVLFLNIVAIFRRKKNIECFHRRIDDDIVRKASCVATLHIVLIVVCAVIISWVDKVPMNASLFETASAISMDGMTLGITPTLDAVSQCLLIFLMFFGRAGTLTVLLALSSESTIIVSRLPAEKIQIG